MLANTGAAEKVGASRTSWEQIPQQPKELGVLCKSAFCRTLQHHYHLLPAATLLPTSGLQGTGAPLWLLATWRLWFLASRDGMVGPCQLTLMGTSGRFKVWETVDWFAEADKASQKNRCSPFPTCEFLVQKREICYHRATELLTSWSDS